MDNEVTWRWNFLWILKIYPNTYLCIFSHSNLSYKYVGPFFLLSQIEILIWPLSCRKHWTFSTNIKQFAKKNGKILERSMEIVDPISFSWQMNKQGLERLSDLLKIICQVSESAVLWFPFQGSFLISRTAFHVAGFSKLVDYYWCIKWNCLAMNWL